MRILITDGNERSALAAARSLIAAGHDVHVASRGHWSLAGASRGVRRCRVETDPLGDAYGYACEVGGLIDRLGIDMALPVTDPSVEALLEYREALPGRVHLPLPDLAAYRRASDKAATLELARAAGLAVPPTVMLETRADGERLPGPEFFPAVVKPHRSVVPADQGGRGRGGRRKVGVAHVADAASCRAVLAGLPDGAFPVLLQQRVHGPGEGLFGLRWNGRMVATFAHRRLREKPPEGGVSVYRESIAPPAELIAAGTKLLAQLRWQGVAMVECKRDLATGRFVFMEVNGRLWGSLQLAIDAGVDFPALLVACALGSPVAPASGYRVGVRSRWFWGDVDHLYLRLRDGSGAIEGATQGGRVSRLAAVRDFLHFRIGRDREEIWRWRDPGPFLLETLGRFGLAG
jgi:predicted ATP-grasp superfamily ATP-dependent carboligase